MEINKFLCCLLQIYAERIDEMANNNIIRKKEALKEEEELYVCIQNIH